MFSLPLPQAIHCPGQLASLACQLEVCAPKPGNVHRAADFPDMGLIDFLASATAIQPIFAQAPQLSVGQLVRQAVEATQRVTSTNTNLGIVLLLAPLAKVAAGQTLSEGIGPVLASLTADDAADVFYTIRRVSPGGLIPVDGDAKIAAEADHDVRSTTAPDDLLAAMRVAADWDLIAKQYVNGFHEVLHVVLPWLTAPADSLAMLTWAERIVWTQLRVMAEYPDSLIARKCGQAVAREAADRAAGVLESGAPDSDAYHAMLADFDFWLRSDHNRRNPGTTADLIAAALFAALREQAFSVLSPTR